MPVCIFFASHRQQQRIRAKIFLRMTSMGIYVDIFWHYKKYNTQIWHNFVILNAITNEKTVKLIQLDTIGNAVTRHPALAGSNNSVQWPAAQLVTALTVCEQWPRFQGSAVQCSARYYSAVTKISVLDSTVQYYSAVTNISVLGSTVQ